MSVNSVPERRGDLKGSLKFIWILEKNIIPVLFLGAGDSAHLKEDCSTRIVLVSLGSMCLSVPPSARDRSSQGFVEINLDFFPLK